MTTHDELYAKATFVGYSLWVVPETQTQQSLVHVIRECAQRLQTPAFQPHMTLLGGVTGLERAEAITKTKQVADSLRTLCAEIRGVTSKDLYFQCVFTLLALSDELADAHRTAKQIFHCEDDVEFMPHISLVYGDLSPATKQELVAELGSHFESNRVVVLDRLQLWSTTGPVSDWELVSEMSLSRDE